MYVGLYYFTNVQRIEGVREILLVEISMLLFL